MSEFLTPATERILIKIPDQNVVQFLICYRRSPVFLEIIMLHFGGMTGLILRDAHADSDILHLFSDSSRRRIDGESGR